MSDDGFEFGDDEANENDATDADETGLFGTSNGESPSESPSRHRFGSRTIESDSRSATEWVETALEGSAVRTAAVVAASVVLVVALALVAYPLVMGGPETADSPSGGAVTTTDTAAGPTATPSTSVTPAATPRTTPTDGRTATIGVTTDGPAATTTIPTATPTRGTTTRVPTRAFPAGSPIAENATNASES